MTTTVLPGHVETMTVHFDDLDALGIVHNARYALMVERALASFWARHGYSYAAGGPTKPDAAHAVAEYSISYKFPITSTGDVGVHIWLEKLGRTSAVYRFRVISADGSLVHAEGHRVNIRFDPATLRPTEWTPEAREIASTLLAEEARQ